MWSYPYFYNRPSTPQSLGYGSNISEPMSFGHFTTTRRVISDTTNSPTRRFSTQSIASSSDHTRRIVPSRKKPHQFNTTNTKENQSTIYNEKEQHLYSSQTTTRPLVFERLGPNRHPTQMKIDWKLIFHTTTNVHTDGRVWVTRNVQGISQIIVSDHPDYWTTNGGRFERNELWQSA